ncbi:hypothetical protein PINS_up022057 [Pythium insidiosum]|nr:hypothetical protein PINS_up011161 [Pythium insidiosum]GLE10062.1 hypothetical protein PINS_up022057 [Pythium insidiosum]
MTISRTVYNQLFEHTESKEQVIRLRPTEAKAGAVVMSSKHRIQMWTTEEHERFLEALEMYPSGPWKKIADHIGTKTPRQTMTHAQKYRQKIYRRQRGLRNQKRGAGDQPGQKVATSPSGVADLNKNGANGAQANPAHSGFGLLDILAYSAAAAAQSGASPNREGEVPQQPAYPQASATPSSTGAAYVQTSVAPTTAPQPSPTATSSPSPAPSADASSGAAVNGLMCGSSHLPPLSEILQLRGSQQVAQL